MQIGKVYISKIYSLWNRFIFGLCFDISEHVHKKNESGEFQDLVKWVIEDANELVITIEFLKWGIDFQISK